MDFSILISDEEESDLPKAHLCEFPLNSVGSILIFSEDLDTLEGNKWLNDNIISTDPSINITIFSKQWIIMEIYKVSNQRFRWPIPQVIFKLETH